MLHLLVCPQCGRQFDADHYATGERLQCSCGATVDVATAVGHDAAVVRCSACGAPRNEETDQCRYCGSSFTMADQDLDTVCPHCLARISGRARFCHYCGGPILIDQATAGNLALPCPACVSETLRSRQLGRESVAVAECGRCGGLWLDNTVFAIIAGRARQGVLQGLGTAPHTDPALGAPLPVSRRLYRPCPVCRSLMNRHNYGRSSGIILDLCHAHGIWFDLEELPRLLKWIQAGGEEAAHHRQADEARDELRQKQLAERTAQPDTPGWGDRRPNYDLFNDLADALGEGLRHLFRRP
jgi:Zn-finger nucleic acid-binding protein